MSSIHPDLGSLLFETAPSSRAGNFADQQQQQQQQHPPPLMNIHSLLQQRPPPGNSPPAADFLSAVPPANNNGPMGSSGMPSQGPAAPEPAGLSDLQLQLHQFRESDRRRDELVTELVRRYQDVANAYARKCNDYEQERKSLAMWQREHLIVQAQLNELKLANESNPFVFAILDGDGAVFRDDLLSRGAEGGTDAAFELLAEIRKYLKKTYPDASVENWAIMVQVVINLEGHARTLHAAGIVQNGTRDLTAFAHAFGQAQSLFSFIDVGSGKERTDHKIRETLRVMPRIMQCRHVIFGPCHDGGYLPVLDPYKRDPVVGPKLILLETTPPLPGFVQLGLNRVKFPTVFRSEPIIRPPFGTSSGGGSMPLIRNGPSKSVTNGNPQPTPQSTGSESGGGALVRLLPAPKVVTAPPQPASGPHATPSSYATAGKPPPAAANKTFDVAPRKQAPARKFYYVNSSSERVDEDLPRTIPAVEKRYNEKRKANGRNFCNNYHLLGDCEDGDHCRYEHGDRLTPQELLVQKHRARGAYCENGTDCEDFDCYYSHHCRNGRNCPVGHKCKFNDTHHMDLRKVAKIYEDGSREKVT